VTAATRQPSNTTARVPLSRLPSYCFAAGAEDATDSPAPVAEGQGLARTAEPTGALRPAASAESGRLSATGPRDRTGSGPACDPLGELARGAEADAAFCDTLRGRE